MLFLELQMYIILSGLVYFVGLVAIQAELSEVDEI